MTWLKKFFEQLLCIHWWGHEEHFIGHTLVPEEKSYAVIKCRQKCLCCDAIRVRRVGSVTGSTPVEWKDPLTYD